MTIKTNIQEVRRHLADQIDVIFSGSDKQNCILLQSLFLSYLNQRSAAASKMISDQGIGMQIQLQVQFLKARMQLIKEQNYWKHCHTIVQYERVILETLPARDGQHQKIRNTMIGLIAVCKKVAKQPSSKYYKASAA